MRPCISALCLLLSLPSPASQDRQARQSQYMKHAELTRDSNTTIITANSPRPLAQALTALSERYHWIIDFEDPPYFSKFDLTDDTAPQWRAAHPDTKGVTVIAGGAFRTEFAQVGDPVSSALDEAAILNTVVADYNASSNPGTFSVVNEGDVRFAVVGIAVKNDQGQPQSVAPVLDTPISIPSEARDAQATLQLILDALNAKSRIPIVQGTSPLNLLAQTRLTLGGENIPARKLLAQTLAATNSSLVWHLYYDHDVHKYALNVLPVSALSRPPTNPE